MPHPIRTMLATLSVILCSSCGSGERSVEITGSEAAISGCKSYVELMVRSPATLNFVKASSFDHTLDSETDVYFLTTDEAKLARGEQQSFEIAVATVTYDAANAFGTPVRSTEICAFPKSSLSNSFDKEGTAKMIAITRVEQFAMSKVRNPGARLPLYPCCISNADWETLSGVDNQYDVYGDAKVKNSR